MNLVKPIKAFSLATTFLVTATAAGPVLAESEIVVAARDQVERNAPGYRPVERKRATYTTLARKQSSNDAGADAKWWQHNPDEGPIQIIVSKDEQKARVYVGGRMVSTSRVSTGKRGHSTPTGLFSILQKNRHHRSNIYSNAPMPFMQRLTWSGIALHASNSVPNYPASHGCVRLPHKFAGQLFRFTQKGAQVIINNDAVEPRPFSHKALFDPYAEPVAVSESDSNPFDEGSFTPQKRRVATLSSRSLDGPEGATPKEQRGYVPSARIAEEITIASLRLSRSDAGIDIALPEQPKSTSPVRVLITRRTGRELIKDVQRMLNSLGYNAGDVDGWMGRDTGSAIARFQEAKGLQKSGAMSAELVRQLFAASGRGEPLMGHIYVRQDFKPLFDAPVGISDPDKALGAHVFTTMAMDEATGSTEWSHIALSDRPKQSRFSFMEEVVTDPIAMTPHRVLDRIDIPAHIRSRIAGLLTPGSSLAISDNGISSETGRGTDFVVLTR